MTRPRGSKERGEEKPLTEVELELMTILWKLGEGSVAEVILQLPKQRQLAYTSVSTILRILEQKKVLRARKEGRGHIYIPVVKKEDYEKSAVRHVVERVFDRTPVTLVRQLLDVMSLSQQELTEIKSLIEKSEREAKS